MPPLSDDITDIANAAGSGEAVSARLMSGVIWTAWGAFASSGLSFIAMLLVARQLGATGYGELTIVQNTIGLFVVGASLGLTLATTKYVSEWRVRDSARAGRIIGLSASVSFLVGGFMSGVLFASASQLAHRVLVAPHLTEIVRIASFLLWAGALEGVQLGVLSGLEAFRALALLKVIRSLVLFPMMVSGAYLGGLTGAVWGLVGVATIGLLANAVALHHHLRREALPICWRGCLGEWRILTDFGVPALLSTGFFSAGQWAAEAVLIRQRDGYAALGVFQAANRLFVALQLVSSVVNRPLLPVLTDQWSADERTAAAGIVGSTMAANARLVGPLALAGCFIGPYLMRLFGPEYAVAWPTLLVVLLTAVVAAVCSPIGHWVMASGRAWTNVRQYGAWAGTLFVLTVILASWGSLGFATAQLGAYGLYGYLAVRCAAHSLSWPEFSAQFRRGLTSSLYYTRTDSDH